MKNGVRNKRKKLSHKVGLKQRFKRSLIYYKTTWTKNLEPSESGKEVSVDNKFYDENCFKKRQT